MLSERQIKAQVRKILDEYPHYRFMPVPTGFGKRTLDYLICFNGLFLAIETKAPGEVPTAQQEATITYIRTMGKGKVFVIDGDEGLIELRAWLEFNTHHPICMLHKEKDNDS